MIIQWKWQINKGIRFDRVPKKLWMEFYDIVQEVVIIAIPNKMAEE